MYCKETQRGMAENSTGKGDPKQALKSVIYFIFDEVKCKIKIYLTEVENEANFVR